MGLASTTSSHDMVDGTGPPTVLTPSTLRLRQVGCRKAFLGLVAGSGAPRGPCAALGLGAVPRVLTPRSARMTVSSTLVTTLLERSSG